MFNKKNIFSFVKKHALVTIFLTLYTLVIGFKLTSHVRPFFDWDEAIYAQVGHEMVTHNSVVPLWQGAAWLDKPPLVPLLYGLVGAIPSVAPELSTRLFTLIISIIVLSFIYALYYRISKNTIVATFTVAITAFMPIFLQRTQVVNIDVFLLLGWLGYVLFYDNFVVSFIFLGIGFFSKSLLGLYPPTIFFLFYSAQVGVKQITFTEYKKKVMPLLFQVGIVCLWYVVMYVFYGNSFIQEHFIESHLKRVTASIESHFGKRTFYIDLLVEEFNWFVLFAVTGFLYIVKSHWNKIISTPVLLSFFFLPWFVFLNLTKTKIAWYYYPTIPQFAFLAAYSLLFFKKINKALYLVGFILIAGLLINKIQNIDVIGSYYSNFEPHYYMSLYAKDNCEGTLHVVVDKDTRVAHDTLQKLNLLISTSTWWGNHASIVYYYGKQVDFIYDEKNIASAAQKLDSNECIVLNEADDKTSVDKIENLTLQKVIAPYLVYIKS